MKMSYQLYDQQTAELLEHLMEEQDKLRVLTVEQTLAEQRVTSQKYKIQKIEHDLRVRINAAMDEERDKLTSALAAPDPATKLDPRD